MLPAQLGGMSCCDLSSSYLGALHEWSCADLSPSPEVCPCSSEERAAVGVQINEILMEQWVNSSVSAVGAELSSSLDKRAAQTWRSLS